MRNRILLAAALALACVRCSTDDGPTQQAGDVTETRNAFITGKISGSDGQCVPGVRITLVPGSYHPVQDSILHDSLIMAVVTDSQGVYGFNEVPPGTYNILGTYQMDDFGLFIKGVEADEEDSIDRGTDTLYWTGMIEVYIDSTSIDRVGFLYIPGTDIYHPVDSLALARGVVRVEHLPPGDLFDIRFFHPDDMDSLIFQDVHIHPEDTILCPGGDCPPPPPPPPPH